MVKIETPMVKICAAIFTKYLYHLYQIFTTHTENIFEPITPNKKKRPHVRGVVNFYSDAMIIRRTPRSLQTPSFDVHTP